MNRLVAIDIAPGAGFVTALQGIWDAGDAALPVDQRLPSPARQQLLQTMAAAAVLDAQLIEIALPNSRPVETGDALVMATSGSTGAPRGVVLTHANIAASSAASNKRLGVTRDDHWLVCLPLCHVGGLSAVIRAIHAGCQLTVHPNFDAANVHAAARAGATMTSLVTTALNRIDSSIFRKILLGGGAVPQHKPDNVVATYGMTESASGVVYDAMALDGVEIRVSPDGEIIVKAPMLLRCYRDGFDPKTVDGWYATGDIGEIASDDRLAVHGRRSDLIITGGENVWPRSVESVLERHPNITEAFVRGVSDPQWGQRIVAWLATTRSTELALNEIREWVKQELPAFCAPRQIVCLSELPRTAIAKIDAQKLFGLLE